MTESSEDPPNGPAKARKRTGGLNTLLLADLKSMAGSMGISGAGGMKKAQLVEAIKGAQSGPAQSKAAPSKAAPSKAAPSKAAPSKAAASKPEPDRPADGAPKAEPATAAEPPPPTVTTRTRTTRTRVRETPTDPQPAPEATQAPTEASPSRPDDAPSDKQPDRQPGGRRGNQGNQGGPGNQGNQGNQRGQGGNQAGGQGGAKHGGQPQQNRQDPTEPPSDKQQPRKQQDKRPEQPAEPPDTTDQDPDGDGDGEGRRNRRRRGRDRDRTRPAVAASGQRNEPDTTILDDDVLVPAAGILDVLDNYAFVRTSGYLPGPDDVYVSLSMVRRLGLRRGDAITGEVRQPRDGERREKFNPMVRIDTVNGSDPEAIKDRFDFAKLTPVHPTERLRLETAPDNLVGRVIDLIAPVGKGQRGLIVSPARCGKTTVLQAIAGSITTNNPECHLMVVLVDERPEEVTDFERLVKGEVVSSTFDRPASDHTMVAELAIERAKRLVELGHDVVLLVDGITRLGRAYNLSAPAGGRVLAGGVDASALLSPKRFFGAARNLESGGSLTILATAQVESGSTTDESVFDELRDTGNWEVRLSRELTDAQVLPAIDASRSGTRHEEQLLTSEELEIAAKLRRGLATRETRPAAELLLQRLRKTHTNIELLMQVQRTPTWPGSG